jgi:SAM-dependent methyltransferase
MDLAEMTGTHPRALYRFLRMLVVLNLLVERRDGRFALTAMGQFLRPEHPESIHDRLIYIDEISYSAVKSTLHSLQTGKPAFDAAFGESFFSHLSHNPRQGAAFNRLMAKDVSRRADRIASAYDFKRAKSIVDIGGGTGTLLKAILSKSSGATGTIFDTPDVVAQARLDAVEDGCADRMEFIGGDLFRDDLPSGADIYLMSNIIHDWDDAQSKIILQKCRKAVGDHGVLLMFEEIVPGKVSSAPQTIANDYTMLLLTGGRQRTRGEFRDLLAATGFKLASVSLLESDPSKKARKENWAIVEARPVKALEGSS